MLSLICFWNWDFHQDAGGLKKSNRLLPGPYASAEVAKKGP